MNSVYFGIFLGIFIGIVGEHILIYVLKKLKERKEGEIRKTEEMMKTMIDKVMGECEKERR